MASSNSGLGKLDVEFCTNKNYGENLFSSGFHVDGYSSKILISFWVSTLFRAPIQFQAILESTHGKFIALSVD